jgi:hypothetical protein
MSVVFINHLAGAPKKNDISLRHYFFAQNLKKRNIHSTIITSSKSYFRNNKTKIKRSKENIDGIDYFFIDESDPRSINIFTKFLRMVSFSKNLYFFLAKNKSSIKANYVYASSPDLLTCLVGYFYSKKISAKFIFEVRDIWPLSQVVLHGYSKFHPVVMFLRVIEKYLHRKANIVVSNLPNYRTYLSDYALSFSKYIYAPQIVDLEFYKNIYSNKNNLSNEYNHIFENHKNVGIYSGTIGSYYGIKNIVDAFIDFNKTHKTKDFALIIMGDGDRREQIKKIKKENNIDNLYILDSQKKSNLFKIHKKCTFGIVSFPDKDLYQYGIASLKMLDYLFSGLPILMIGPFNKYSILKYSSNHFHANFGDIPNIAKGFHDLFSLSNHKRKIINEEYKKLLSRYASSESLEDILAEIENNNISY